MSEPMETRDMDEEELRLEGYEDEDAPPRKARRGAGRTLRRAVTALLTLALLAGAGAVFLYRDQLSRESLRRRLGRTEPLEDSGEPFSYENGSEQCFALAGNGLAVASGAGVRLFDEAGRLVFSEIPSMLSPAVTASKALALFYDVGGSVCTAALPDGTRHSLAVGESVISAAVNPDGYIAVISEASGYKGLVRVFDAQFRLVYEWYSGSGYALRAQVGPDDRSLAVLCVTDAGSVIHYFRLDSEQERGSARFEGELLYDLYFMSSDRVCAIGEKALHLTDSLGGEVATRDFGERSVAAYDFGSGQFAAVYICRYRTGEDGLLFTVDQNGVVLGELEPEETLTSLSASGRRLLTATAGGLCLYSGDLQLQEREDALLTAKKALLRPKGDVLLLSSYSAEPFHF